MQQYPQVSGQVQLTEDWSITLPTSFSRRIEDGDLVFWRPGLTLWLAVWDRPAEETPEETLDWIKSEIPEEAEQVKETKHGSILRIDYQLQEHDPSRTPPDYTGHYSFTIGETSYIQLAAYDDTEKDRKMAESIVHSLG